MNADEAHQQELEQEESEMKNAFVELAAINVNSHVEKKNGLSYLSWAWALDQLLRADPSAVWEYQEPRQFGPTMMVYCTVTAFGIARTCQLPVMDHRNKCIPNPDAFAVNTAMQRCLVKAIAMHGLGLYIYAGEDIPLEEQEARQQQARQPKPKIQSAKILPTDGAWDAMNEEEQQFLTDVALEVVRVMQAEGEAAAHAYLEAQKLDGEEKVALWTRLDSKVRSALKRAHEAAKGQAA